MAIPQVNITIQDGALGLIQPSSANVQAKLGICANAIPQASAFVQSTTTNDGVTWTAVAHGSAGNAISIAYNAPSGGSTTVSVNGNAITVSPKTGETNAGVVTAVAGNSTANALLTGVAVVGTDLVVAATAKFLTGGGPAAVNGIYSLTDPTTALNTLGQGPLTEAVAHSLYVSGGQVYAVPVNPSVAGVAGAVTHNGPGGGTVTVTGAPYDAYNVVVAPVTTGALGVGTFQYSLDGGTDYGPVYAIPAGGTFIIPNTGLTLTFAAGTYTKGDTFTFSCTPPGFQVADVTAALNALTANAALWGWVHVVGAASTSAGAASVAAAVDTAMQAAATAYRYAFGVVEVGTDTDANIQTAFASFSSVRTMVCIGTCSVVSSLSGYTYTRSSAWPVTARMAKVPISQDLGAVSDGALPAVTAIQRDEQVTPGMDALNYTTLRTIPGLTGFYVTTGHMFAALTSDYSLSQNRRVMDVASTTLRGALLPFLNASLLVNKSTGGIADKSAARMEAYAGGQLSAALVGPGQASGTSVVVNRNTNVLSTKQVAVTARVTPLGYAKDIEVNIAFQNPALPS